jgi:hypothetical protein
MLSRSLNNLLLFILFVKCLVIILNHNTASSYTFTAFYVDVMVNCNFLCWYSYIWEGLHNFENWALHFTQHDNG